jgi:dTDP-L-rhamnose 4-epimerase
MPATFLITGGAGFIGRYLVEELAGHGHRVRVLDSLVEQVHGPSGTSDAARECLERFGVELLTADIRDRAMLHQALEGVDGVVHLAAEVGVGQSMYEIARYVGGNDLGTAVLLEALIERPVPRLVVASSMSVYGEGAYETAEGVPVRDVRRRPADVRAGIWEPATPSGDRLVCMPTDETKTVDLASIYALTKYAQERSALIIGDAYPIEVTALRLFNVFGPGQALSNPYTGVLANFGARLMHGERPMVFEDGAQRRDFVHVRDVAAAFHLALTAPGVAGEVFNIGSGRSYRIADVARLLADAMGVPHLQPQILMRARAGDIRHCFADISKARDLLGFVPGHTLEDSMAEMAAWIARADAMDRGLDARRQLEAFGLVS